jgi:hypothetical protein
MNMESNPNMTAELVKSQTSPVNHSWMSDLARLTVGRKGTTSLQCPHREGGIE